MRGSSLADAGLLVGNEWAVVWDSVADVEENESGRVAGCPGQFILGDVHVTVVLKP